MKNLIMSLLLMGGVCYADLQSEYPEIHGTGIYTTSQKVESNRKLNAFKREIAIHGLVRLAERTEQAMGAIFKIAVINLQRKGHFVLAREVSSQWDERKGALIILSLGIRRGIDAEMFGRDIGDFEPLSTNVDLIDNVNLTRDIGDFDPLSQWLAEIYDKIENALGYEMCRALRISDLKSLNYGIRVIFSPCPFGADEFQLHFVHDSRYRGVFPVVVYWVSNLACSIGTFGIGSFWLCGPLSMLIEMGADKVVGPWLAPKLYSWACD